MARVLATLLTTQDDHQKRGCYAEAPLHLTGKKVHMQIHQAEGEEPVARYYDYYTGELVGEGKVKGVFA